MRWMLPTALVLSIAVAPLSADTLKWYPSRCSLVYEGTAPNGAQLVVTDAKGAQVFGGTLTSARQVVPVVAEGSVLANGAYRATLTAAGASVPSLVKDFVYTNYPWFNTSVGTADILLPGFTSVRTKGCAVEVVGRRYAFGVDGLPTAVWTDGKVLAAKDAETGAALSVLSGCVSVSLEGHGFAMIELTSDRALFPCGSKSREGTVISLVSAYEFCCRCCGACPCVCGSACGHD